MTATFQPDYQRLLKTIRHEEPDRVPLADFQADTALKDKFMGRPVRTIEDHVAFQAAAGFDFIYLRANYDYPGTSPVSSTGTMRSFMHSISDAPDTETVGTYGAGPLQTRDQLDTIDWPDPATVDVSDMQKAAAALPPGLGLITGVGGIFTRTWMLMGYEHFCDMLADDLDFVAETAARVGKIQCAAMRRVIKMPGVVAAWYGDDLAYTESLLVSPKILRKYFFPWIEELAGIAHAAGMPFIMHSDGRLWQVLDDLIALGVNALHPIEAKAMDIYDLKRRYGQKIAIFGNIDMGYTLTDGRGTPEAVRAEVRQQIQELAPGGGYGVATGAGLTRYVSLENFLALREALLEYGSYPIRV
jgi:uroporphyrinogen decarboxylase